MITLKTINSASMSELKDFAHTNNVNIDGDRRKKASFINSITAYLIECSEGELIANEKNISSLKTPQVSIQSTPKLLQTNLGEDKSNLDGSVVLPIVLLLYGVGLFVVSIVIIVGWIANKTIISLKAVYSSLEKDFEYLFNHKYQDRGTDNYLAIKHLFAST